MVTGIRFLNIILVALVSGATFGIWFGYNPKTFSASTYIEQQQGGTSIAHRIGPFNWERPDNKIRKSTDQQHGDDLDSRFHAG